MLQSFKADFIIQLFKFHLLFKRLLAAGMNRPICQLTILFQMLLNKCSGDL